MSYAPAILIKVSDNIIMILKCPGSCIGVGFWNLVKWKKNNGNQSGINPFQDEIHSMIHICDSFELMSKVNIQFGVKKSVNTKIDKISIKLIDNDGSIVLYPLQDLSDNDGDSNSNRKRSLSDDMNDRHSSSSPPKKRKLN